jgi:catechol 2,3-dioxygenase-like lactoylglutathione lyase family enzyme
MAGRPGAAAPHRGADDRGAATADPSYRAAMIDHLELLTADLSAATAFYARALAPLGYVLRVTGAVNGFGADATRLDFWLRPGAASTPRPHFAFACASRSLVDASHRAALQAGATDNGAPRLLTHIHPTYYAGFVLDLDGHNVEFVCHS